MIDTKPMTDPSLKTKILRGHALLCDLSNEDFNKSSIQAAGTHQNCPERNKNIAHLWSVFVQNHPERKASRTILKNLVRKYPNLIQILVQSNAAWREEFRELFDIALKYARPSEDCNLKNFNLIVKSKEPFDIVDFTKETVYASLSKSKTQDKIRGLANGYPLDIHFLYLNVFVSNNQIMLDFLEKRTKEENTKIVKIFGKRKYQQCFHQEFPINHADIEFDIFNDIFSFKFLRLKNVDDEGDFYDLSVRSNHQLMMALLNSHFKIQITTAIQYEEIGNEIDFINSDTENFKKIEQKTIRMKASLIQDLKTDKILNLDMASYQISKILPEEFTNAYREVTQKFKEIQTLLGNNISITTIFPKIRKLPNNCTTQELLDCLNETLPELEMDIHL